MPVIQAPPAQFLRRYLLAVNAITATGDWGAKVGGLPNTPDNYISISDTTPILDGRLLRSGEQIRHQGIQIRIRGKDYPGGWGRGAVIASALENLINATVVVGTESILLQSFTESSGLTSIGPEEVNLREHFTINGTLTFRGS